MSSPVRSHRACTARAASVVIALVAVLLPVTWSASPAEAISAPAQVKALKRYARTLEVGWTWNSKAASYQVRWATDATFTQGVAQKSVKRRASRPAGGLQTLWIDGLQDATKYFVRVRSVKGTSNSAWSATLRTSTPVLGPVAIQSVSTRPTTTAGEVQVNWALNSSSTKSAKQRYAVTDFLTITVASTGIDSTLSGARDLHRYRVAKTATSFVLTADQAAACGVGIGSGRRAFIRVSSWSVGNAGSAHVNSPLFSEQPLGRATGPGAALRIAQFNVASSAPDWSPRAQLVANELVGEHIDVATVVELRQSPANETSTLMSKLATTQSGQDYRVWPAPSATTTDNRIVYDATKVTLIRQGLLDPLPAPHNTVTNPWPSPSWAEFRVSPSSTFYVVSLHLPSGNTMGDEWDRDAGTQQVLAQISGQFGTTTPVVIGGDFNSSQTWAPASDPAAYSQKPHDRLMAAGYYDTASARQYVALRYSSKNEWKYATTGYCNAPAQQVNPNGPASRIDELWTHGMPGSDLFKVVVPTGCYPSDHDMVWAQLSIPG